ncbi:hypothetical protein A0H81_02871 [Grifola frondosa]|uniref:Uncharacterized protein n=1 Tax=Grifola frondosa TaxID=5627 RepID=A0A1C7MLL7_GRIFR|nr:hypothetical protein A0H81_02871 [Grifola frondosa]
MLPEKLEENALHLCPVLLRHLVPHATYLPPRTATECSSLSSSESRPKSYWWGEDARGLCGPDVDGRDAKPSCTLRRISPAAPSANANGFACNFEKEVVRDGRTTSAGAMNTGTGAYGTCVLRGRELKTVGALWGAEPASSFPSRRASSLRKAMLAVSLDRDAAVRPDGACRNLGVEAGAGKGLEVALADVEDEKSDGGAIGCMWSSC